MFYDGGDDDDKNDQNNGELQGGPDVGKYAPPKNMPIPGETQAIPDSQK